MSSSAVVSTEPGSLGSGAGVPDAAGGGEPAKAFSTALPIRSEIFELAI